ncbi:methyltransferase family protein [Dethiosulfovibrio salsuginis]|uniref:Protein-S-isoprenylcysteine O-methyltransferase Ste14 n=1 Tax=Dethiosulfovibrio salsuginis TaxID=561720 RepID=A0A1X7JHF1_9BACT|nr:isoprenylcysteine carboxylmethyltransferase family protein [Dethiosulfovibrio salsuginis]SMG27326.1 Protein-S-isoprenylcysteine O-methyltransferase Ste14 [Dethiosulfovibrio salsuginis]
MIWKGMVKLRFDELQRKAFRLRGGVWTALFLAILFVSSPSPGRILIGLFPVLLGQALRFWAVGCIVLYRGEKVKADRLVTWGPYSLARNPLYVANGLIGLGWGLMSGFWGLLLFAVIFVGLYGILIVPWEEGFLRKKFGKSYLSYCRSVGPFYPLKWPPKVRSGPFDSSVIWRSEVHSVIVTLLGTVLIWSRLWW